MAKKPKFSYLIVLNDMKLFSEKPLSAKEIKRLENIFDMRLVKVFEKNDYI